MFTKQISVGHHPHCAHVHVRCTDNTRQNNPFTASSTNHCRKNDITRPTFNLLIFWRWSRCTENILNVHSCMSSPWSEGSCAASCSPLPSSPRQCQPFWPLEKKQNKTFAASWWNQSTPVLKSLLFNVFHHHMLLQRPRFYTVVRDSGRLAALSLQLAN